ncbi:DExH-box ATP-dependent RNA helicase DExH1 [Diplonema papillatum]|nr:DExH-box ATP-dependent RNA helicase DExH1 [Diplonema papillatum]
MHGCRVPRCACPGWKASEASKKCASCNHGESRHGELPTATTAEQLATSMGQAGLSAPKRTKRAPAEQPQPEPAAEPPAAVTAEDAEKAITDECNAVEFQLVSELGQRIGWAKRFKEAFGSIGEFIKLREDRYETSMSKETTREGKNGKVVTIKAQLLVRRSIEREAPHHEWTRAVSAALASMKERNSSEEELLAWQKRYQDAVRSWLVDGYESQLIIAKGLAMPQKERIWLSNWCGQAGLSVAAADGHYIVARPADDAIPAITGNFVEPPVGAFDRFCRAVQEFAKNGEDEQTTIKEQLSLKQMLLLPMLGPTGLKTYCSPGHAVIVSKREITDADRTAHTSEVDEATTLELTYPAPAVEVMQRMVAEHEEALAAAELEAMDRCERGRRQRQHGRRRTGGKFGSAGAPKRKGRPSPAFDAFRTSLPAWGERERILRAIEDNRVVIISGETGSGKTTQIPQYILDYSSFLGDQCILCTQPRRISAIGVANRVAEEREQKIGGEIGYQIRFETVISADTRLSFCTTGVFLKVLHENPKLEGYGVVILDEVHERDRSTDFALILLRDLMKERRDLKVILMSATLSAGQFVSYCSEVNGGDPPIVTIEGKVFPVHTYFLEDALEWTGVSISGADWQASPETQARIIQCYGACLPYSAHTIKECAKFAEEPKVEVDLVVALIKYLHNTSPVGAFLVFLPGWGEIKRCEEALFRDQRDHKANVIRPLCLHSHIPMQEQSLVFDVVHDGRRKVVFSTNIAETSVTIPDIVVVIDTGVKKEKGYDITSGLSKIEDSFVAKANAVQRRGRAGRVQEGKCVHLFPRYKWQQLEEVEPPELIRTPLEEIVLTAKMLTGGDDVRKILSKAPDVPSPKAVEDAITTLKQMGALTEEYEHLTPVGRVLADFPCHPLLGRMLAWGALLKTVRSTTMVSATLQSKGLFTSTRKRGAGDVTRQFFMGSSQSDHFKALKAYQAWASSGHTSAFCKEKGMSHDALKSIKRSIFQFDESLEAAHLIEKGCDQNKNDWDLVRASIAAGLYPNVAQAKGYLWTADKQQMTASESRSNLVLNPMTSSCHEFVSFFEKCMQNGRLLMMDGTKVPPGLVPLMMSREVLVEPLGNGVAKRNASPPTRSQSCASSYTPSLPCAAGGGLVDRVHGSRRHRRSHRPGAGRDQLSVPGVLLAEAEPAVGSARGAPAPVRREAHRARDAHQRRVPARQPRRAAARTSCHRSPARRQGQKAGRRPSARPSG